MNSRMEKYENGNNPTSRTIKNKNLYEEIDRIDVGYVDLNSSNIFEINDSDRKIKTRENYKKYHDLEGIIPISKEEKSSVIVKEKEERIYDIDEILKKAKEELHEEESKKRLLNTEYNILTKLDLQNIEKLESNDLKEEELKKIVDEVYPKKEKIDTNEELFADLRDDTLKKEIFEKETGNVSIITPPLEKEEKELQKTIIDTTMDTELFSTSKSNKTMVIITIILIILIIGAGAYLLLKYFNVI